MYLEAELIENPTWTWRNFYKPMHWFYALIRWWQGDPRNHSCIHIQQVIEGELYETAAEALGPGVLITNKPRWLRRAPDRKRYQLRLPSELTPEQQYARLLKVVGNGYQYGIYLEQPLSKLIGRRVYISNTEQDKTFWCHELLVYVFDVKGAPPIVDGKWLSQFIISGPE
jgi:hypothetical protein